jgi:hypothetical protein
MELFLVTFAHEGKEYDGWIKPLDEGLPPKKYEVVLNEVYMGNLVYKADWQLDQHPELSEPLSDCVAQWWSD